MALAALQAAEKGARSCRCAAFSPLTSSTHVATVERWRELATITHAAQRTLVRLEERYVGGMREDEMRGLGWVSSLYVYKCSGSRRARCLTARRDWRV